MNDKTKAANGAGAEKVTSDLLPWYTPRFWGGLRVGTWLKLLAENNFVVAPSRLPMAAIVSLLAPTHSALSLVQHLAFGKKIAETKIEPPVFILGHWRSGTTFLHELMMLDKRNTCPTTYECFVPHHCLLTHGIVRTCFNFLLPANRPMDRVAIGWDKPQEDEFALVSLGVGSPYFRMAYPQRPDQYLKYLDFEGVPATEMAKWEAALEWFVKLLTFRRPGRVVLKSPPHTARIGRLAKLFPGAKFIHIVRDPAALVRSNLNLWKTLDQDQCFRFGTPELRKEYVLKAHERMYAAFDKQAAEVPPERLCHVRYEDLAADPTAALTRIYRDLELGDFESLRPVLSEYLAEQKPYEGNKFRPLDPDLQREISTRWRGYYVNYGYPLPPETPQSPPG